MFSSKKALVTNLPRNTQNPSIKIHFKEKIHHLLTMCAIQVGRRTEDNFPKLDSTHIQGLNLSTQGAQFQKTQKTPIFQFIRLVIVLKMYNYEPQ